MRKRQYLAELQRQAQEDTERKAAERMGAGGREALAQRHSVDNANLLRAKSLDQAQPMDALAEPGGRGREFAARLKREFEAALHQAHQQVAAGAQPHADRPTSGGHAETMVQAMQRWEHMFVSQVSASLTAVSELNAHVARLDEKLATQAREKVLLSERMVQAELALQELHSVKIESQAGLRQILDGEQHKARRLQLEIRDLHASLEHVSGQQASAKVMGDKALDDLRSRQVRFICIVCVCVCVCVYLPKYSVCWYLFSVCWYLFTDACICLCLSVCLSLFQVRQISHSGSMEDRFQALETQLREASATLAELQAKGAQEAQRHGKALANATDAMAQVDSRVRQVEERIAPDMERCESFLLPASAVVERSVCSQLACASPHLPLLRRWQVRGQEQPRLLGALPLRDCRAQKPSGRAEQQD